MTRPPEPNYDKLPDDRLNLVDVPVTDLADLARIVGGSHDSFKGQLLALMCKADPGNRARLASAFPYEHTMLSVWQDFDKAPTWRQLHNAYIARRAIEQLGEQPC